ncbi:MAG: thiamine pyrophosphate-dependent enzyme [Candidatus Binatia bacterium]|nr:thiamine pyrophosphate-dependent enzyme [Candidatus Binatia bacterium]
MIDDLLEVYRRACLTRAFELQVKKAVEAGRIKVPVYLCVGQEFVSAALSVAVQNYKVFGQHRCHGLYLAFGGDPAQLRDELLSLPTGCAGGMAGSNAIQGKDVDGRFNGMFGHSGLVGEQVPIACGFALASGHPTLTVFGDAAVEEDYFAPALGFAATHKLPVLFICEDNNLSILTKTEVRRSWSVVSVASGYGIHAFACEDDPLQIFDVLRTAVGFLPALVNIKTTRHLWHAGTGNDGGWRFDRMESVFNFLASRGHGADALAIDEDAQASMETLWK